MQETILIIESLFEIVLLLFLIFRKNKTLQDRVFIYYVLGIIGWVAGIALFRLSDSLGLAKFWVVTYYLSAALIAVTLFQFSFIFPSNKQNFNRKQIILSSLPLLPLLFIIPSKYFINKVILGDPNIVILGPFYHLFGIWFISYFFVVFYNLFKNHHVASGIDKLQLKYVLFGTFLSGVLGVTFNLILPWVGNYNLICIGPLFSVVWLSFITYAIIKHKLFDLKVLTAALFGSALSVFTFIQIVLAQGTGDLIIRSVIFIVTTVFVVLLIRSVLKEVKQKEQLEKLTQDLTQTNQSLEQATLKLQSSNKSLEEATQQLSSSNKLLDVHNKHLETLQKFSNIILQSYRLEEMSQRIIDYIPQEIENCDIAFLGLVDSKANALVGHTISKPYAVARQVLRLLGDDLSKYKIPLTDKNNLLVKMMADKQPKVTETLYNFLGPIIPKPVAWALQNLAGGMSSAVAVPLVVRGQAQGALAMTFNKKRSPLTKEDMTLFLAIADQVGIALERTRVYEELASLNTRLNEANHYLKDLDQAKTDFLNLASHQLRTPTTGVKGFLSMILEGDYGKIPPKQKEVLDLVYANVNRLIRLINVFLNVSRIESGSFKLGRTDLDMIKLAQTVITELTLAAQRKKLQLKLAAPKRLPIVSADADKIHDVLLNLVDNAIKYTEKGSVTVNVTLTDEDIKTSVTDTGMGLTKDEIQHLFAKFGRTERVNLVDSQGTGLGLFIAKKIVEAHGGSIGVTSAGEGKGATFSFTLPLHPPATATAIATLPAGDLAKAGEGKK